MSFRENEFLKAIGWDKPVEAHVPDDLFQAMRELSLRHAERLRDLGPVRVMTLDPCPQCGGTVIASDTVAACAAGCGWKRRQTADSAVDRGHAYTDVLKPW